MKTKVQVVGERPNEYTTGKGKVVHERLLSLLDLTPDFAYLNLVDYPIKDEEALRLVDGDVTKLKTLSGKVFELGFRNIRTDARGRQKFDDAAIIFPEKK